ncbi:TetR/AcrR family transcriptional regulator [Microbacterium sp.]|uniref:TetR/AcrR family transcriptional regulator n=1 Tax=Microbacterium sp. TaxID=51671 RepID=UPI0025FF1188|nr:TetR family transcriptional regulator [Microbacterium sp.]
MTPKSERTRALLRDLALRSFRDRGYDATTIRLIATEAGVSVGTTNYHFASKADLVQELYVAVQEQHRDAATPLLSHATDLIDRLRIVYTTGLDQLGPYHSHAAEFVSAALAPRSTINPLSDDSAAARSITESLFSEAVSGAKHSLPADLEGALPRALFLAHLLLALSWVYDGTPGQQRTRALLDRGLALLKLALPLARMPLVRKPLAELLALIGDVRT